MRIKEEFYTYLWQFSLFLKDNLRAVDGRSVEVVKVGTINSQSGPDFYDAHIKIEGLSWFGHIEIHVQSDDWVRHKHHEDKHYDSVILHVVGKYDGTPAYNTLQNQIPTIELSYNPEILERYKQLTDNPSILSCASFSDKISTFTLSHLFSRLAIERLEVFNHRIELQSGNCVDWDNLFYGLLLRSFGLPNNAVPCELLHQSLPMSTLRKHLDSAVIVEALLFGQAGFLDIGSFIELSEPYPSQLVREYKVYAQKYQLTPISSTLWKFGRNRPQNYPTLRLSQFAQLITQRALRFSDLLTFRPLSAWHELLTSEASSYWNTHYCFAKTSIQNREKAVGRDFINRILGNVVVPLLAYYAKDTQEELYIQQALSLWEMLPPEKNHYTKKWSNHFVAPTNMLESQAVLHLMRSYCTQKLCVQCDIGCRLMKG